GIVATVVNIDALHRALGAPPEPLPEPRPGEPSRQRPETDTIGAWVPVLALSAPEAEALFAGRSRVAHGARALSLVPDAVLRMRALSEAHYLPLEDVIDPRVRGRRLARPQIELIAGHIGRAA